MVKYIIANHPKVNIRQMNSPLIELTFAGKLAAYLITGRFKNNVSLFK